MITLAPDLHIEEACSRLRAIAQQEGRVPACWLWGEDVRAAWSHWMDSEEASKVMVHDPNLKAFPDHRICEYAGLPAYPMLAEGVALRTREHVSGFD